MKKLFFILLVSTSIFSCNSTEEKEAKKENEKPVVFLEGKIDSVVHFTHEPNDLLENELVLIEKDARLTEILNDENYNELDFDSLTYYYNSSKVIKDAKRVIELNSYFQLVDESKETPENKCVVFYRDIFKFYSSGNLVALAKICFSCQQSSIHIYDLEYRKNIESKKLKVMADIEGLEKLLN